MLTIDARKYGNDDFNLFFGQMEKVESFHNPEGKRYALCLKHAFELLGVVMYLRERGGSVLLMHAETPLETARKTAGNADCAYLLFEQWQTVIPIGPPAMAYEPAVLQYSSGTTGMPTLIARPWKKIDLEISHYNRFFDNTPYEHPVILVPVSHSFGLITGLLASWARGVEPTIVEDKNPKFALHVIRTTRNPIVYTVPFIYNLLDSLEKGRFACHKAIISGSPPSQELLNRMRLQTNEIWQQYGCTEAGCISVSKHPAVITDVGRPLGHLEICICSEEGIDTKDGKGQIIVTQGGLNPIFTKDFGEIHRQTGDLHVYGRLDDLINVSGLKVIPFEVEAVIAGMPGVRETVVVKTAHRIWGEAVRALVVAASSVHERDIRTWCLQRLPAYKVPSVIELVAEIPKAPSGKVSRRLLIEQER